MGRADAANVGIVAFSTDRNPENPQRMQAFCRVANFADEAADVLLELFLDDVSVDIVELSIDAGTEKGWQFDLPELDEAILKLVMRHEDALALDNVAFAAVNRPQLARVMLVTPGDETLRQTLRTQQIQDLAEISLADPSVLAEPDHQALAAAGT